MNRRKFLKNSAILSGLLTLSPSNLWSSSKEKNLIKQKRKAKNIIFMISDGMSIGTLTIADLYSRNILGKRSNWLNLYNENKITRALMDTASANSIVTDSAAASSAFGGGIRVKNGTLNIGANGEKYLPIWKIYKQAGKKAGCVTTVTITHATPAGFCVNSSKRNAEPKIAEMYADLELDILMGGGDEFFNPLRREDKKDLYSAFHRKGYQILKNKNDLQAVKKGKKLLGIFSIGALPYSIDRSYLPEHKNIPMLSEMTKIAINQMQDHIDGFVLQIEAGKVDWAAHTNDVAALIHDQLAFDKAIQTVIDFAEKDGNTLVIITTDHGNSNPGIIYGTNATRNFNSIAEYKYTNEYLLNRIQNDYSVKDIKDWIYEGNKILVNTDEAKYLQSFYNNLEKEEGLYNYKKLPFKVYSKIQKIRNSVGWIGMDHSGDYVEVAAYGPGSELLKPFIKNTDLYHLMLNTCSI